VRWQEDQMAGWRKKLYDAVEHLDPYFDDRLLIVSGLYLLGFLEFDVAIVKSSTAALAAYVMMILPLGRRFIEYLCVLLIVVAMARWTDIAGINELASAGLQHFADR
jgi:hypothetical protein